MSDDFAPQGSAGWLHARLGRVTASRLGDLMAVTKDGKPAASRRAYMIEMLVERLTGTLVERHVTAAMQWGKDFEAEARAAYEFQTDATVEPVGFVPHPSIPMFGASPDGLVGEDGQLETKCPTTAVHLGTLLGDPIDRKYVLQMQGQMMCSERCWTDFASFDPRVPANMGLHVRRVEREPGLMAEIAEAVMGFNAEIDATLARLSDLYGARPVIADLPPLPPGIAAAADFLAAG